MGTIQVLRTCSQCARCPLRDRNRVPAETPADSAPLLAIFGEAPGRDEDYHVAPFVGASGHQLNWALGQQGIQRHLCHVSNIIQCRPPDNQIDSPEGADAVQYCKAGFYEELRYLKEKKVTTILALGVTAMKAFGINGAMEKYRGSVTTYDFLGWKFRVIPTYHPAFVMRQSWTRVGGGTAAGVVSWLADIHKAHESAIGDWTELKEDFTLEPTIEQVEEFCREAVDKKHLVAVDIETTGLHYDYCKIVVVGLATSSSRGMSVPLLVGDTTSYWRSDEHDARAREALRSVLRSCPQLYQNGFFDIPLLRRDGFDIPYANIAHDTILLHHTVAAEAPHNLGHIVSVYGRTPYWKEAFQTKRSIFDMDSIEMRRYNLRDCVVLHQVTEKMLQDLKARKLEQFYEEEVRPLIEPIMEMTANGVGVDLGKVSAFKRKITKEIEKQRQKLLDLGGLPSEFSFDSDDNLRWFLYGKRPDKFDKLADIDKKKKGTKVYAELQALKAVADAKPLYLLGSYNPRGTDTGKSSVNQQALLGLQHALCNRLAEVKAFKQKDGSEEQTRIEKLLEWLAEYGQYAALTKLCSTYAEYKPRKDGRIHPSWKTHGTVSGRLSCSNPNLQNLPRIDESDNSVGAQYANEIRGFFVAAPGYSLLSADYVNLEAALLAYETLEPDLVAVFTEGLNLHDLNTKSLFDIDETHPLWKEARNAAKVFFFGGISYGGGPREVFEQVSLKAPRLNLTYAQFVVAQNRWFELHPRYVKWKTDLEVELTTRRYTETSLGRGRVFLANDRDILKQGLDFKIQSAGASLMNRATARIHALLRDAGLDARLVMQIHDELIFEVRDDQIEAAKVIQREEMERPFMMKGIERRILVEQAVGKTLAEVA
jgi:uracil-DNA glycosylase family 4